MKKTALVLCLTAGLLSSNALLASGDKQHFIGVFAGMLDSDADNELILGLEYEFKVNSEWGVGLVYENSADAHHEAGITSIIGVGYYHPAALKGWRFGLGFGQETGGSYTDTHHVPPIDHPEVTENLIRVGVSYDFHVGGMGIEPSLNIDTIDGNQVFVYGVALVWSF